MGLMVHLREDGGIEMTQGERANCKARAGRWAKSGSSHLERFFIKQARGVWLALLPLSCPLHDGMLMWQKIKDGLAVIAYLNDARSGANPGNRRSARIVWAWAKDMWTAIFCG